VAAAAALGVGEERYYGGSYDGHADAALLGSHRLEFGSRFAGGAYDGHADADGLQADPEATKARFTGGPYDGYEDSFATDQPSPLLQDSDDDGLADWWELVFADALATLHGLADFDGDGATESSELVADTNPTNAASVFRITAMTLTNSVSVVFMCTNSRNYSLEGTVSLATGPWTFVAGQTNVPGGASGRMSLTDTNDAPFRAYRIHLHSP
jgi:hypothetical protein